MNEILRRLIPWTLVLLWPFLMGQAVADLQEGSDYRRLASPVPTSVQDKIEVVELFWYGCPHCYSLEPAVEEWVENKPDNAAFVRIPAVLNRNWELDARVFHTAESLGVLDKIHRPYFEAIHKDRRRMTNEAQVAEFFAEQGVDKEDFHKAFNSFDVETRLRRSQQLVQRYRISGVPSFIVNGKYEVSPSMAGSQTRIFEIINSLVEKEGEPG